MMIIHDLFMLPIRSCHLAGHCICEEHIDAALDAILRRIIVSLILSNLAYKTAPYSGQDELEEFSLGVFHCFFRVPTPAPTRPPVSKIQAT